MGIDVRPFSPDEFEVACRLFYGCFGEDVGPELLALARSTFEFDRCLAAYDGDRMVGTAAALSLEVTLPGGRSLAAAGVTWVGVRPTHRRRGIQRAMLARQLDDIVDRGEAIAALVASEAEIYGRYGYGLATSFVRASVRTEGTELSPPVTVAGTFESSGSEDLVEVVAELHEDLRHHRAGTIKRSTAWWDRWRRDAAGERHGSSSRHVVVHAGDDGMPDGYATYRYAGSSTAPPGRTVVVEEIVGRTNEVEAALLQYLLRLDLVAELRLDMRPVDDPLRWRFVDARRYHVTRLSDLLWVRLVDVATALEGRTYSAAGTLPVRVVGDSWRPDNNASFVLEVDETGAATCARSHSPNGPHLEVPIDALGAAFLGGTPVAALAAAGRITGPADLVERADRMLATSFQPFCDLRF